MSLPSPLYDMQLIPADSIDSGYTAIWAAKIGYKLDEGWRTAYSHGSGRANHHAAASVSTSRRERLDKHSSSKYLGTLATVVDAERLRLALNLHANRQNDMLLLLTDSMAAYRTILGLASGNHSRSGIEMEIAKELHLRSGLDTGVSWVRSHISIPGNEKADKAVDFPSHLGQISRSPNISTYEGMRVHGKAIRNEYRAQAGLGNGNRVLWRKRPLSAYMWMRTNRGPQ